MKNHILARSKQDEDDDIYVAEEDYEMAEPEEEDHKWQWHVPEEALDDDEMPRD